MVSMLQQTIAVVAQSVIEHALNHEDGQIRFSEYVRQAQQNLADCLCRLSGEVMTQHDKHIAESSY